jgi:membrane fusion protein, multidrug efflux system
VGYLEVATESGQGVIVPRSAIVRSAGQAWVYVRPKPEQFTRRVVSLDWPTGAGWFVTTGLSDKDTLVVVGAQLLLSEEQKSSIQMID